MELEKFVSQMMSMNTKGRLWHWGTDSAQHHVTFEQFLTQNEQFTDSFVESVLGNDIELKLNNISVDASLDGSYSLDRAKADIAAYRGKISELQGELGEQNGSFGGELTAILDDAVELCSKTLYLLRLK